MFKNYADGKMMVKIENNNQLSELRNICKKNDVLGCRYDVPNYPVYYCFLQIIQTGKVILAPDTDKGALEKNGWKEIGFKEFKNSI